MTIWAVKVLKPSLRDPLFVVPVVPMSVGLVSEKGSKWGRKWYDMRRDEIDQVTDRTKITWQGWSHRFCIAPMMEWTDRHCRFFHRLLTRRALIYTEMLTTGAVLRGDRARLLDFDPFEHPVAFQLGGSDPVALAASAPLRAEFCYDSNKLTW